MAVAVLNAELVLAGYAVLFLLCGVWRVRAQLASTGESGLRGAFRSGSRLEWLGGALTVSGHGLVIGYPALEALGWVAPAAASPWAVALGIVVMVGGIALVFRAQAEMGASWRVAVRTDEKTPLVTAGLFSVVRNPIFSGMILVTFGAALAVPGWPVGLGALMALAGLEIHVRFVEEPYLARVHGDDYGRYAGRVGRFVPRVGRIGRAAT